MQKEVAASGQSESPKLVLAGKFVQLLNIDPCGGFAKEKIDDILKVLEEILNFGKPENGLRPSQHLSELSYKLVFCHLLSADHNAIESYQPPKPYAEELQRVAKNEDQGPIFAGLISAFANLASVKQVKRVLGLLLTHQMYDDIIQLVNAVAIDSIKKAMIKFFMSNLKNPGLLALSSKISVDFLTRPQQQEIFNAVLSYCQQEQNPYPVCGQFLNGMAQRSVLSKETVADLLSLFRNLSGVEGKLYTAYFTFGFRPLTVRLFPLLSRAEKQGLIADECLKLTSEEVGEIVVQEKEPTREYLDEMSSAIHYPTPLEQANPRRSKKLTEALARSYSASSWGFNGGSQFSSALENPIAALTVFGEIKNIPALFALFEQFGSSETTKKMFFLQSPSESIKNYLIARESHKGNMSEVDRSNRNLSSLKECYDRDSYLSKKAIPFVQSCQTLATQMNKEQAEWLLRFLINDKALHVRIKDLITESKTNDAAYEGYLAPYMEVILDQEADPELKSILLPLGGVLMEMMTADQFLQLLGALNHNINTLLTVVRGGCREGGKDLKQPIVEELVKYFLSIISKENKDDDVAIQLFFDTLCGRLIPAMSEEQRLIVLKDPRVKVSESMMKALPLLQTPVPANSPAQLVLSPACVRILMLRSATEYRNAVHGLFAAIVATKDKDAIASVFTEYLRDQPSDSESDRANRVALRAILVKDHLLEQLPLLMSRVNIFYKDAVGTKTVSDLLETVLDAKNNDAQLKQVIEALINGCNGSTDELKYADITRKLFQNPELHARLFTDKGAAELFKSVVDSFANLDREVLNPIFDFIFSRDDLAAPLVQLLKIFTGMRVVRLNTNNNLENIWTHNFLNENISYLLNRALQVSAYSGEIRKVGTSFIVRCCDVAGNVVGALAALKLYLQFGCRPSEEHMSGEAAKVDIGNPFHLAALYRNVPLLELLLPYLKRVGPVMLGMMISAREMDVTFSKEAFDVVFNAAKAKDPDCFKDFAFCSLYKMFRFSISRDESRLPILEAYLSMIEAGIQPSCVDIPEVFKVVIEEDKEFEGNFRRALEVHAPNSYLIYQIVMHPLNSEEEKARVSENVQRIFHEQENKLSQLTLEDLLKWARSNQRSAEFIARIEAKIVTLQPAQPAPLQFFGGGSNAGLLAKAPRKKEVLAPRSPSKVAAQETKSAAQDRPATTEPQFFGGGSNAGLLAKAPLKKEVLAPKSPAKAETQPKQATELVFGGGDELPRLLPPLKKAVLVPRSLAKKPSAEGGNTPSKMNLGLN